MLTLVQRGVRGAAVGLAAVVAAVTVTAQGPASRPAGFHPFLATGIGLTAGEVASLTQGRVVVKTLDPGDRREVGLAGVVRIEAPRERMIDGWRDIVAFRKSEVVLEMGTFGEPPQLGDLAALTVDRQDIDDLAQCRPGSCKVQLSAGDIGRFQREIDWRAGDRAANAAALMHDVLFTHLQRYRAKGLGGLGTYDDRREPVVIGDELSSILSQSPSPLDLVPELRAHVVVFPVRPLPAAEEGFYWSKERFGFKPVTGLTHTTLYVQPSPGGAALLVSRQIYANHYLDGSVGVSALLDVPGREGEAFDLLYVNRTRSARMTGFFGGLARSVATGRARDAMGRLLGALKRRTERPPATASTGR
jgi:hypothetical protein